MILVQFFVVLYSTRLHFSNSILEHTSPYRQSFIPDRFIPDISYRITKYDAFIRPESITDLLKDIETQKIQNIYFTEDLKKIYTKREDVNRDLDPEAPRDSYYNQYSLTYSSPALANQFVDASLKHDVGTFILKEPTNVYSSGIQTVTNFASGFVTYVFAFYLLTSALGFLFNRGRNNNNGMLNNMNGPFGTGSIGNINKNVKQDKENMQKANISLSDWAGSPEIFEECAEVVSYLRNSTLYENAGAQIPKGILLEGSPGTGKTLIAKAIASECDANFISVASSEFVEVFVGVGAQKVRNLFTQARENTPCILFIDEIDSIGKQRGTGINLGNDEREQTLNQLLAEMDGFNTNDGVLIIAATNRRDVLDSALLRPGRFDRIINVPLPDKESRKAIFKVHTKNKQLDPNIQYDFLAELSAGFSGAQIKNLVNEGAINAARTGNTTITQRNLEEALEKIVVGIAKKTDGRNFNTQERVSVHEIGHAFLAAYFNDYFDLKKVTIQATYNGAGGYTLFNEKPELVDGGLYTKELLKKRLIVAMGGKAAETLIYGDDFVSLGAVQDLKQANQLAQSMIGNYGMGEELKVFYNENTESGRNPFLGRSLGMGDKYSDRTKQLMDDESLSLVNHAFQEACDILKFNKPVVESLYKELTTSTTLDGSFVVDFIRNHTVNVVD